MSRTLQLLTGTPVNKPTDAYAYIKLKTPGIYRSFAHFENLHVEERDFFKKPIKFGNLELLKNNFNLQTITRTREEVHGQHAPDIFPDCEYSLSREHITLYNKLVEEQLLLFDDGTMIDATSMQKLRHALQQVVVNFDHFSNNPKNVSTAYDLLDHTLEEIEDNKLIVWINYRRSAASVLNYLKGRGITAMAAYGGSDSQAAVSSFMDPAGCQVLVGHYQSCGAGLNPQEVCFNSLFLELSTVPLYVRQALGRVSRTGQKKIPIQRLAVARGTVQVHLLRSLVNNDDLVATIEPTKKSVRAMLLGE